MKTHAHFVKTKGLWARSLQLLLFVTWKADVSLYLRTHGGKRQRNKEPGREDYTQTIAYCRKQHERQSNMQSNRERERLLRCRDEASISSRIVRAVDFLWLLFLCKLLFLWLVWERERERERERECLLASLLSLWEKLITIHQIKWDSHSHEW